MPILAIWYYIVSLVFLFNTDDLSHLSYGSSAYNLRYYGLLQPASLSKLFSADIFELTLYWTWELATISRKIFSIYGVSPMELTNIQITVTLWFQILILPVCGITTVLFWWVPFVTFATGGLYISAVALFENRVFIGL